VRLLINQVDHSALFFLSNISKSKQLVSSQSVKGYCVLAVPPAEACRFVAPVSVSLFFCRLAAATYIAYKGAAFTLRSLLSNIPSVDSPSITAQQFAQHT
jgi:hypothetical protein